MDLSDFIAEYTRTGHQLLTEDSEVTDKNLMVWTNMFSCLDGAAPPGVQPAPDGAKAVEGAIGNPGTPYSAQAKGEGGKTTTTKIKFKPSEGCGFGPVGKLPMTGVFSFTEDDWNKITNAYKQDPSVAQQHQDDADNGKGDTGTDNLETELTREDQLRQQAADVAGRVEAKLGEDFKGKNPKATQTFFSQMMGFGGWNAIKRAALKRIGLENVSKMKAADLMDRHMGTLDPAVEEQRAEDMGLMEDRMNTIADIALGMKNDGAEPTDSQKEFLRDCVRLRGAGEDRGVYLLPGGKCGGDFAAVGVAYQDGGQRYGIKIGNHNSGIYEAAEFIENQSKKGGRYEQEDGKPLIFRGSSDTARMSAYRAMDGVMNEFGPMIALAWVDCGRKEPCEEMVKELKKTLDSTANFDLDLLIFGAEQRQGGQLEDSQFGDFVTDGIAGILNEVAEANEGNVDGNKALAWYLGGLLNSWDAIVSSEQFKDCDWSQVGQGRTGTTKEGDKIDEDNQVRCGKAFKFSNIVVNKKNNVKSGSGPFGTDEEKNRGHYSGDEGTLGVSVKMAGGPTTQYGKIGQATLDGVVTENGKVVALSPQMRAARNRHGNYFYESALQNGVRLEPVRGSEGMSDEEAAQAWMEEADNYKMEEVQTLDTWVASVQEELKTGGAQTVLKRQLSRMGFEESEKFGELQSIIETMKNGTPQEVAKATKQLRTTLKQGYRNQALRKNKPGARANIALEYGICSHSTRNQAMALTGPQGEDSVLMAASDGPGTAAGFLLGIGTPDGMPAQIKSITGTSITFDNPTPGCEGGTISMSSRLKEGTPVQEATESSDCLKSRGRTLSGAKAANTGTSNESRREAEDIIREFQKLIQRVNKVNSIEN